ncbi:hypothetical protein [Amycolatopsis sp.]|uniref:hypothetical protein n=1 Tax=Amycolatopsis sp. TaxID=37632 RepID=UPI002D8075CA|nr:hypothetical protein [Amycolatopsis sp.]HET6711325.1 hypothetical protein [Amycolatopsis sp.]
MSTGTATSSNRNAIVGSPNRYAAMVDMSTPETRIATLGNAAQAARVDASNLDEAAAKIRRDAAADLQRPGMRASAEERIREAARMEEDAERRRGQAAAYDNQAAAVPV